MAQLFDAGMGSNRRVAKSIVILRADFGVARSILMIGLVRVFGGTQDSNVDTGSTLVYPNETKDRVLVPDAESYTHKSAQRIAVYLSWVCTADKRC
jgi:hypothetical protein